jgi:hypothetical protein
MEHDFNVIYQICGPDMQSSIEDMIIHDQDHIKPKIRVHISACINYLLSINDELFRQKYQVLYDIDNDDPYTVDEIEKDDIELPTDYNKYDFIFACVSNINLINRCLVISKLPLSFAINRCTQHGTQMFINFDLESCKLLQEAGFDNNNLLAVACAARDYNSIKYILMYMTELNLGELIMDKRFMFKNLTSIYIIDKIHYHSNDFLKQLLKTRHFSSFNDIYNIIIICYYIIRYLSREDGLSYINDIDKYLDDKIITLTQSGINVDRWIEHRLSLHQLINHLLEFHFRPRGGHTKASLN